MSFFDTLIAEAKTALTDEQTAIVAFFESVVSNVETQGGTVLTGIVQAAVQAAETAGGTGAEKFDAAMTDVLNGLEAVAIPFVENTVKGLIEAAVAAL